MTTLLLPVPAVDPLIDPALLDIQQHLEDACLSKGGERFRRQLAAAEKRGEGATVGAAKQLLVRAIEPCEKGLQAILDNAKAGRRHAAVKWIDALGAPDAAFIICKTLMDLMHTKKELRQYAQSISLRFLDELRYRRFEQQAPGLWKTARERISKSRHAAHRKRSLDASLKFGDIPIADLEMTPTESLSVGMKMIDVFVTTTGLMSVERGGVKVVRNGTRHRFSEKLLLVPSNETLDWLQRKNDLLQLLHPAVSPMVVPPLPWGENQRGGYRFALKDRFAIVRGASKHWTARVERTPLPVVYRAVNAIQSTPWKINSRILEVVEQLVELGMPVATLGGANVPLPSKPPDIETNLAARRRWRREAALVQNENYRRKLRRLEVSNSLREARTYQQYAAFFFPFSLDFRGRLYPLVTLLSPQGDDLSKGLLLFAEGKPLGDEGAVWLALHGAAMLDTTPEGLKLSKCTLQERVNWIQQHTKEITDVAENPLEARWWLDADKPLQFLAFCLEWAGFARAFAAGLGRDFVCALPVAQDGTCNGVQHFAAMCRDPVAGRWTNLVPLDHPEDLYQRVCDGVLHQLEGDATNGNPLAAFWLGSGLVTRKLVKRPAMTYGYGSRRFGFATQIESYLRALENWQEIKPLLVNVDTGKTTFHASCRYLAFIIAQVLETEVMSAAGAMAWLRTVAGLVVGTGRPVEWTVPHTAFPVRQEYYGTISQQIRTIIAGKLYRPRVYRFDSEIAGYKQRNAIAPNFVHSLDAAVLQVTVGKALDAGITSFAMVHDSYATLAADAGVLARVTREAFVAFYQQYDPLQMLASEVQPRVEQQVPSPPLQGNLDISGVLESPYFFC